MTLMSCRENNTRNCLSEIRDILISIGMAGVWQQQRIENAHLFLYVAKQSLKDLAFQKYSYINDSNKCIIYKHLLKNHRLIQPYLNIGVLKNTKTLLRNSTCQHTP